MIMRFGKQLKEFMVSNDTFRVLYQTTQPNALIHILDSSFNPPHFGHLQLITASAQVNHVVLLLSVNNADKAPKPASFEQRLDMMYLFGESLTQKNIDYSICLSKSAKFIDKSYSLNDQFAGPKHYLMGYDTLIRVLDQKYYSEPIKEVLHDFIIDNKFICLTRYQDYQYQMIFLNNLKNNTSELPGVWADSIELIINDDKASNSISSSDIRNKIVNNESIDGLTYKSIIQYINDNNIYKI